MPAIFWEPVTVLTFLQFKIIQLYYTEKEYGMNIIISFFFSIHFNIQPQVDLLLVFGWEYEWKWYGKKVIKLFFLKNWHHGNKKFVCLNLKNVKKNLKLFYSVQLSYVILRRLLARTFAFFKPILIPMIYNWFLCF